MSSLNFIPGKVTVAQRNGEQVPFIENCPHACCWFWQFEDGSRSYYWDAQDYEHIMQSSPEGVCPTCGNTHIRGGFIEAEFV